MQSYTDLEVWKIGLDLVEEIYNLTKNFPPTELYGITSQMRRASTSIVANLAEGFGRFTYADKAGKFIIARGECTEIWAFLQIVIRLKLVDTQSIQKALQLTDYERRLISGLISSSRDKASFKNSHNS